MPKVALPEALTAVRMHLAEGSLANATIGVWGLTRRAVVDPTALSTLEILVENGATVRLFDYCLQPEKAGVAVALDPYEAARDADVLVTFGEAGNFSGVDMDKVREIMASAAVVDATPASEFERLAALGFSYAACTRTVVSSTSPAGFGGDPLLARQVLRHAESRLRGHRKVFAHVSEPSYVRRLPSLSKEGSLQPHGLRAKRAFDLLVGLPLALAALPLIGLFAIGIAASFRCWPFFTQWRAGRNGEQFRFLKIRTLPPNTPAYAHKFNLDTDSLPRLARFLRKQHLDELPQLLLVPLGKMSLVGPRPKMPDDKEPIEPMFGRLRTTVPQGCTGLWQIGEHAHLRVCDSADYDYAYLRFGGVMFDIWVLWRTALLLVGKNTPISLSDEASIPRWVRGRGYLTEDVVPVHEPLAA